MEAKKKITICIAIFVCIAVIVLVLCLTFENKSNFIVTQGASQFLINTNNSLTVKPGKAYTFSCKNTDNFKVYVVPSTTANFDVIVDGDYLGFAAEKDYTSAFQVQKTATGFILILPQGMTMESVLKQHFGSFDGTVPLNVQLANNFALKIVHNNGQAEIFINLIFGG